MSGVSEEAGGLLRRLREGADLSQDELARRSRLRGFGWTRSTLAKIERGERDLTLEEFLRLPELFKGFSVSTKARILALNIRRRTRTEVKTVLPEAGLDRLVAGDAERKAAKSLNQRATDEGKARWEPLSAVDIAILARRRFGGRSLTEERDRMLRKRPAAGSIATRRGHVTGELLDLLWTEALEDHEGWTPGGKK
jgi:transcriptional regulator with XRE-family HTH domain